MQVEEPAAEPVVNGDHAESEEEKLSEPEEKDSAVKESAPAEEPAAEEEATEEPEPAEEAAAEPVEEPVSWNCFAIFSDFVFCTSVWCAQIALI